MSYVLMSKSKIIALADAIRGKFKEEAYKEQKLSLDAITDYLSVMHARTLTITDAIIRANAYADVNDYDTIILKGVETIEGYAFENCTMTTLIFEDCDSCVINSNAFRNCENLTCLAIDSARTICSNAFYGCDNLMPIWLSGSIGIIEQNAFRGAIKVADSIGKSKPDYTRIYTDATSKPSGWATNWDQLRAYSSIAGSSQLKATVYYSVSKNLFITNMETEGRL